MNINNYKQDVVVVIKKPKIRIADNYGAYIAFLREGRAVNSTYKDFLMKLYQTERDRLQSAFTDKLLVENNQSYYQTNTTVASSTFDGAFGYYYIVAGGGTEIGNSTQAGLNKTLASNTPTISNSLDRIISVQTTTTVTGASSCNITIDNTGNLFFLKSNLTTDLYQTMDCLIEPMDEVVVYMKETVNKTNPQYKTVFTGYVNSVNDNDDGSEQTIEVTCEDMTKKSSITRTNVNPSLDTLEAEGNAISIYNENYTSLAPTDVIKNILTRTYCDLFNNLSMCDELSDIFWIKTNNTIAYRIGADLTSQLHETQTIISEYIEKYTQNIFVDGKLQKIIGYKALPTDGINGPDGTALKDRDGNTILITNNPVAFTVMGIDQDLYSWQLNGNYDLLISDWKSNDQIIQDLADKAFFEYFADVNGMVFFRPKNLTLPNSSTNGMEDEIKDNYWITSDNENIVRKFSKTINDRELFTDFVVTGTFIPCGITPPLNTKLVISYKHRRKYGVRVLPPETRPGIIGQNGLEQFGRNRLSLANSKFTSASLTINGNPSIKPGMPIFIERWLSVYYIETVSHSFSAGGDFQTTLNLNFKRIPIATLSTFNAKLNKMVANQEMAQWEVAAYNKDKNTLRFGYSPNILIGNNSIASIGVFASLPDLNHDYYIWERISVRMSVLEIAAVQVIVDEVTKKYSDINLPNNIKVNEISNITSNFDVSNRSSTVKKVKEANNTLSTSVSYNVQNSNLKDYKFTIPNDNSLDTSGSVITK